MKYFPKSWIANGQIIESEQINQEFREAASALNQLDRENIPVTSIGSTKLKSEACNKIVILNSATEYDFEAGDISPGWFKLTQTESTITADEGLLFGCFSGTIDRYPNGVGDFDPWQVAIFVNGNLITCTDYLYCVALGLELEFAIPVGPGSYVVDIRWKGRAPPATVSGPPGDVTVFTLGGFQLLLRNFKR